MPALRPSIWSAAMTRKPVILCVDDASSVLEGPEMLLEENGYQVLIAANGKEAVQAFVSKTVDLGFSTTTCPKWMAAWPRCT